MWQMKSCAILPYCSCPQSKMMEWVWKKSQNIKCFFIISYMYWQILQLTNLLAPIRFESDCSDIFSYILILWSIRYCLDWTHSNVEFFLSIKTLLPNFVQTGQVMSDIKLQTTDINRTDSKPMTNVKECPKLTLSLCDKKHLLLLVKLLI